MGALFSSPKKRLETKLLLLQDELKRTMVDKAKLEKLQRSNSFFEKFFIYIYFVQFIIFCAISFKYRSLFFGQIKRELFIFFIVLAIFYFFRAVIRSMINSASERALSLRYKLEKSFKEYTSDPKFHKIKKALKQRGEYFEIDFDSVLRLDYLTEQKVIGNQSFFNRLTNILTRNGPDYRYAIICPYCRSQNGTVAPDEKDKVEYKCLYCRSLVSFDKVIKEYTPDEDVLHDLDEEKQVIEKLPNSDDEALGDL